ncbi:MAG: MgtC/SapB family protein [Desulfobacteraceae bacterium]|nr:MAG: MgtC/SapB family protein [Desulfobacteraceae bacterium]
MEFGLPQETWTFLYRILFAALLGGVLGLERDIHGRGAGLRTHLLVSAGAALFMILSIQIATLEIDTSAGVQRVTDPGRIAAQIVTGIGFLGAGVIIREGFTVRGLTTAACLWVAAAIGMASGIGMYLISAVTTLLALCALVMLRKLERFYRKDVYRDLEVKVPNEVDVRRLLDVVMSREVMIIFFGMRRDYETHTTTATMSLRVFYRGTADKLSHDIIEKLEKSQIPLKSVRWFRS